MITGFGVQARSKIKFDGRNLGVAMFLRILVAVLLGLPGIALAMSAKPLFRGDDEILVFGLLLALALPAGFLLRGRANAGRDNAPEGNRH